MGTQGRHLIIVKYPRQNLTHDARGLKIRRTRHTDTMSSLSAPGNSDSFAAKPGSNSEVAVQICIYCNLPVTVFDETAARSLLAAV